MKDGEVGSLLGVTRKEQEREGKGWIQGSLLDETPDGISCETYAMSQYSV